MMGVQGQNFRSRSPSFKLAEFAIFCLYPPLVPSCGKILGVDSPKTYF
jgi:hypothetical protein